MDNTKKRPRKRYFRPPTARFTTEESKILLEAMEFARSRDLFNEGNGPADTRVYTIERRLRQRIKAEEKRVDEEIEKAKEVGG